ncbi:type III-B CRISPR module-associated Cmr3 family protein [Endozoicomonas sp.]|uniref:type III-B CRISPR module-associated Cmr3 family protein n=1 Tax=Endozoicomonas sp. TaxID=1892382 RepID=UPI0028869426|nr:type III-B CRISPR module-associated Cmr3 family protein [Endozoicomonas sp.]
MSDQNNSWRLTLTPVDSWYFRESRPHGAAGADRLESLFPPPVKTLVGAIRTRLGECLNVDWQAFRQGTAFFEDISINALMGDSDSSGTLRFGPVQIGFGDQGETLFPWPSVLMEKNEGGRLYRYARLQPGSVEHCDLGKVALPEMISNGQDMSGSKVPENQYIGRQWLEQVLRGETPPDTSGKQPPQVVLHKDIFTLEPRLGIAINQTRATVEDGMLYQTSHLRMAENTGISITLTGLPELVARRLQSDFQASPVIRFGAEGRMAALAMESIESPELPDCPKPAGNEQGFMVMLLSDGDFGPVRESPLPGFKPALTDDQQTVWRGQLHGIEAELHCVMAGKPVRRGGWDLKNGRPTAMKSYVPAGSCYFLKPLDGASVFDAMALHGQAIGNQTEWGYGRILCGLWLHKKSSNKH